MTPYEYGVIKTIHFDFDIDGIFKEAAKSLPLFSTDLIGLPECYYVIDEKKNMTRILMRWTYRLNDIENKVQFGSSVMEQEFYITYVNDNESKGQLSNLLRNSHFFAEQEFDRQKKLYGYKTDIKFPYKDITPKDVESVLENLQGRTTG